MAKFRKEQLAEAFARKIESWSGSVKSKNLAKNTFNSKLKNEKYQGHYKERLDRINNAKSPQDILGATFGRTGAKETRKKAQEHRNLLGDNKNKVDELDLFFGNREEFYYEQYDDLMMYNQLRGLDNRTSDEEAMLQELAESLKRAWENHK